MSAQNLLLDFKVRPRSGGLAGVALVVLGTLGTLLVGLQFHSSSLTRAGLELRLEALDSARSASLGSGNSNAAEEAGPVVNALSAPWSLLLRELETASHDTEGSVAILAIEPDRAKGRIRIVAEARDLTMVLAYVQRLQKSRALRFPMLDSHEIRTEDRDQPVRFQISAEWNTLS